MTRRSWLVPEVVQTSSMDCGPASLKALLDGHCIPVSYERLREACQTDVDGTSIETLEETAVRLGLDAEQVLVPIDHVALPDSGLLPSLIVVRQPSGATHFVVAWRRHGGWIQTMDPAIGRRFIPVERFLADVYIHTMPVPAAAWHEYASSDEFLASLDTRMRALRIPSQVRRSAIERSTHDRRWESLARLDAAIRMIDSLTTAGGVRRGREATALLTTLAGAEHASKVACPEIPPAYWSVRQDPDDPLQVLMTGAVLVTVKGRRAEAVSEPLPPELAAALTEPATRPARELWRMLNADGLFAPAMVLAAVAAAACGVIVEAILLRGLFDVGRELTLSGQRVGAMSLALAFLIVMLALEYPIATSLWTLGRKLDVRFRLALFAKLPRLADRYLQSRLISDMAERGHVIHAVRALPTLAGSIVRSLCEVLFTVAALVWFFPESASLVIAIGAVAIGIPFVAQPSLAQRDLRWRTHSGALSRFYFDAMRGLVAIRAHGAEHALRREQEKLLREWAHAGVDVQRTVVSLDAVQCIALFGLAAWVVVRHVHQGVEPGGLLLLAYWTLNLPAIGQEISAAVWQYPRLRNTTLRLLEPLGAEAGLHPVAVDRSLHHTTNGASIELKDVSVKAGGHVIIDAVTLRIAPGEHVGVVGASGAGKSSLVGLLLGWHRPAAGEVLVDGMPFDERVLAALRRDTAWIDPQVQLWNRTLLDNLRYGKAATEQFSTGDVIQQADLQPVLRPLPDGLQTRLGEGGALLSGGEAQRVRVGRAFGQPHVRLAILDEPARGLGRDQRRQTIERARRAWSDATMLCITHDVEDTLAFDRVLVIDRGRVIEDGDPRLLAANPSTAYGRLLDAEVDARRTVWDRAMWRRLQLDRGTLVDDGEPQACAPRLAIR